MNAIKEIIIALLGNPITWGVIGTIVLAVVAMIVGKTKTRKDDAILAMVLRAFDLTEKWIPDGKGPKWLQKTDEALKQFKSEYIERYGSKPPESILELAKDQWAIIAHELKKK